MTGSVRKYCHCVDQVSGRSLGAGCPRLGSPRHGAWLFVLDVAAPAGKRRQLRRGGFPTKRAAEAARDAVVGRLQDGVSVDDRTTVGEWLRYWYEEKTKPSGASAAGRKVRATTARSFAQHLNTYLIPTLGHLPLAGLRAEDISAAYDQITAHPARPGSPMSPATLRRVHATLRSALNAAVRARRIDRNPARFVDLPDYRRPPVSPWSPAELGAFLDQAASHRLGVLFEVMALTGLRRGEALGLRWSDVDLTGMVITVRQQLVQVGSAMAFGPPKTASGEHRSVELDTIAAGALLGHRLAQEAERAGAGDAYTDLDLVFAREDGSPIPPEVATKTFRRLTDEVRFPDDADLPDDQRRRLRRVRLHDLRHGQASLMLAAGVPLAVVSKRLGHSTITITSDTYSHLLEGVGRDAAQRAAALIPRASRDARDTDVTRIAPETTQRPRPEDESAGQTGAPPGTRTPNPRIKSQGRPVSRGDSP